MIGKDWALVAFTLLSQMAVGAFLIVWFTHLVARRMASDEEVKKLCNGALIGVGPIVVLSLLLSLFHLGFPLNAWLAISNLGSSWLSREIFFAVAFGVMWFVCAFMEWRGFGSEQLRGVWAGLTAVVGLLLVFSSSVAYMLPTRPAWNNASTPLFFFSTTFLLGALAAATIFAIYYLRSGKNSETQTALVKMALTNASVVVVAVILIQILALGLQVALLIGGSVQAQASAQLLLSTNAVWLWLRVLVGIVLGLIAGVLVWRTLVNAKGVPATVTNLVFLAFVLVAVGEILGRMLFYAIVVPVSPV